MFTLKLVDHYRKEKNFETFTEKLTAYAKGSKYFSEYLAEANLKEDCHHVVIQWGNQAMALNNAQVAFLYSDGLDIDEFKPDIFNSSLTPEMCEAQNVHERLKEKLATWDSASLTDNGEIRLTSSGQRGKDLSDDETELLRKRLQAAQQDDKPRAQGRPDTFATPYGAGTEREFKFPTGLCNARTIKERIITVRDRLKECAAVPDDLDSVKLDALLCHVQAMALNNAQVAFLYSDGLDIDEFKPDIFNSSLTPEMCEAQNVHERVKESETWDSARLTDNGEVSLTSSGQRGKDLKRRRNPSYYVNAYTGSAARRQAPRTGSPLIPLRLLTVRETEREFKFPTGLCNARTIKERILTVRDRLKECAAVPDDLDSVKLDALLCHVGSQANIIIGAVNTHDPFDGRTQDDFLKLHDTLLSQLV
ncbi:hypothetical protein [Vibrio phage J14]|nr:hypothetical protein [Vibrio phage J14]